MRLLNIIASVDLRTGGPAAWIRDFGAAARSRGHDIETVCFDPPASAAGRPAKAQVHTVRAWPGSLASPALDRWLAQHAQRYDCMIAHGLWRYPSLAAWRTRQAGGPPYLLYPHGSLGSWFERRYPLKHLGKTLYWSVFERRAYCGAARVVYTCEQERRDSRNAFAAMDAATTVCPLGIPDPVLQFDLDHVAARFRASFPTLGDHPYVLWLGRIHPVKGCDLLLRAFAAATRAPLQLVMAGPDPLGWRRELERLAADLGIAERIHWTGMLDDGAKWGALRGAHLFALPSHQENFGISAVEALACGRPVLLSDKVGICDEVAERGAGIIATDDAEEIARALRRFLMPGASPHAAAARRLFIERFEVGRAVDGLLQVAADVMAESKTGRYAT